MMDFDKHDPKDYDHVLSGNYLIRYHAFERILKSYDIKESVSEIRSVFSIITRVSDSKDLTEVEIEKLKIAREHLMDFIANYGKVIDYSKLSKAELNEALLDEGYKDKASIEIVQKLLEHGADINTLDKYGYPPYIRMDARNYDLLKVILEHGADVNYRYKKSKDYKKPYYLSYWLQNIAHTATPNVLLMIEHGANVLDKRNFTDNALHILAEHNADVELAKVFVEKGVAINEQNKDGETALMRFSQNVNNLPCLTYLLEQGADHKSLDYKGRNALHRAILNQYDASETIKTLVRFGIDINQVDADGHTALSLAINKEAEPTVQTLITLGASIAIPLADGSSVYELALSKGFVKIAALLNSDAEMDYSARPEFAQIQKLKEEIIRTLKSGKGWSNSDKEGWRTFKYIGGTYTYDSGEHLSDYKHTYSHDSNEKALEFLYGCLRYNDKLNKTELENWKKVLGMLW